MAILQNGYRDFSSGVRIYGATISNSAYPYALIGNRDQTSWKRNITAGEGMTNDLVSVPSGYRNEYAYVQPQKPGALKSFREAEGAGSVAGAGAAGRNAVAAPAGQATVTGTAQLVVSGFATISGTATVSGNAFAALLGTAAVSASGSATATANALGWVSATIAGTGSVSAIRYGTGTLAAEITPFTELSPQSLAAQLLDAEDIETSMSVRNALRLIAAATAGKVSGAAGTTITIRSAVADSKDRIVATVDTAGNRSAITYDLTD